MNRRCTKSGACLDRWSLGMATRRLRVGPRLLGDATALSFPLGAGRVVPSRPRLALAPWSLALMQVVGKNDGLRV